MPKVNLAKALQRELNFKTNLRIARVLNNLNMERMAKKLGVHTNTLYNYERHPDNITVEMLRKMAKLGYLNPEQITDLIFERTE